MYGIFCCAYECEGMRWLGADASRAAPEEKTREGKDADDRGLLSPFLFPGMV